MGAMTTCVPVQMDGGAWQSAVFFELGGKQCAADRQTLQQSSGRLAISLEGDVIECATASVVMLRFEIMTNQQSPLVGEVLVAPGMGNVQFETLDNLTRQQSLGFYFSDAKYKVIYSQQILLGEQERMGYKSLLDDAVSHDAVIRLAGKYDAMKALKEVVGNYAKRVEPA